MKSFSLSMLFAGLCCLSHAVFAEQDINEAVERLLETVNMQSVLNDSMAQMIDLQILQEPGLAAYRHILEDFMYTYLSYDSLKKDLIELYASKFTAAEIEDLIAFYQTPTGQKAIRMMPEIMRRGGEIGSQRVYENLDQLRKMIAAESSLAQ